MPTGTAGDDSHQDGDLSPCPARPLSTTDYRLLADRPLPQTPSFLTDPVFKLSSGFPAGPCRGKYLTDILGHIPRATSFVPHKAAACRWGNVAYPTALNPPAIAVRIHSVGSIKFGISVSTGSGMHSWTCRQATVTLQTTRCPTTRLPARYCSANGPLDAFPTYCADHAVAAVLVSVKSGPAGALGRHARSHLRHA